MIKCNNCQKRRFKKAWKYLATKLLRISLYDCSGINKQSKVLRDQLWKLELSQPLKYEGELTRRVRATRSLRSEFSKIISPIEAFQSTAEGTTAVTVTMAPSTSLRRFEFLFQRTRHFYWLRTAIGTCRQLLTFRSWVEKQ